MPHSYVGRRVVSNLGRPASLGRGPCIDRSGNCRKSARRTQESSTIFGNTVDLSGVKGGFIKALSQEGSLSAGYALLNIGTARGTDLCFASYRPGVYRPPQLETDAQQAMVTMDGPNVKSMYLAGGKFLRTAAGSIARSEPGLACIEKLPDGTWIIKNPSPSKAEVTVTLPAQAVAKTVQLAPGGSAAVR